MQPTKPNPPNPGAFLTPGELATRWRWHPESVRRWTRLGKLPIVKISRRTLIPLAAVEAIEADGYISLR
jgi:hypothetical protein